MISSIQNMLEGKFTLKIRKLIDESGKTRFDVSEKAGKGLSYATIHRYYDNPNLTENIKLRTLIQILYGLDKSIEEIMETPLGELIEHVEADEN